MILVGDPKSNEAEIVLYDLASTTGVCFSPVVWRVRLMLNYKRIPYHTVFLEFPDIEVTLKQLGIPPGSGPTPYTVPAIHHLPSDKYVMDSTRIIPFLEKQHPPPYPRFHLDISATDMALLGDIRKALAPGFKVSLTPREINILCPLSAEYFRRTREGTLGMTLEELLKDEDAIWAETQKEAEQIGVRLEGMRKLGGKAPFLLPEMDGPSVIDFTIAGALQSARVIDEGVFRRIIGLPGLQAVYDSCVPFMDKKDCELQKLK